MRGKLAAALRGGYAVLGSVHAGARSGVPGVRRCGGPKEEEGRREGGFGARGASTSFR